jgi:uncharacterized protein
MNSTRTRRSIGALVTATLVARKAMALTPAATADPVPEGAEWTQEYFPSEDGTMLHADILRPEGLTEKDKTPVILSIGPYFGTGAATFPVPTPTSEGPVNRFPELFTEGKIMERGYTWV